MTVPRVRFLLPSGESVELIGDIGQSVMEVAKRGAIDGIPGECGGCCACATCHVYVDAAWIPRVGSPSADESDMLDFAGARMPESRLSCQIRLRQDLDGLTLRLPPSASDDR